MLLLYITQSLLYQLQVFLKVLHFDMHKLSLEISFFSLLIIFFLLTVIFMKGLNRAKGRKRMDQYWRSWVHEIICWSSCNLKPFNLLPAKKYLFYIWWLAWINKINIVSNWHFEWLHKLCWFHTIVSLTESLNCLLFSHDCENLVC